jgi:hypothetical protein
VIVWCVFLRYAWPDDSGSKHRKKLLTAPAAQLTVSDTQLPRPTRGPQPQSARSRRRLEVRHISGMTRSFRSPRAPRGPSRARGPRCSFELRRAAPPRLGGEPAARPDSEST